MANKNHSQNAPTQGRRMDFVPSKTPAKNPVSSPAKNPARPADSPAATPVTSAKAAINARFANRPNKPTSFQMVNSAREAVNRAATAPKSPKSAANLHHGSIQRSMESVQTSASALLPHSAKPKRQAPRIIESKNSYDPLARAARPPLRAPERPANTPRQATPVVKTSLKLNPAARPKQSPVILPPESRQGTRKLSSLLSAQKNRQNIAHNPAYQGASARRDPQIVARPTYSEQDFARRQAFETARRAKMADIIDAELGAPSRQAQPVMADEMNAQAIAVPSGRAKFEGSSPESPNPISLEEERERVVADDISRIAEATIAETVPQRLEVKREAPPARATTSATSVVTTSASFNRNSRPFTGADLKRKISPGANNFEADNNPTYSFTRSKNQTVPEAEKSRSAHKNRYSATEKSPFLKSVQVDKRPLSDSSIPPQPTVVNSNVTSRSDRKKEVKRAKTRQQQNLPSRPTVIIPSSRRSRAPLFFLILLTVLLGAIVGTATYFFFFNEF